MTRSLRVISLMLAGLALAACTIADEAPPGAGFDVLDANADGTIEQPEFIAAFTRFDRDGDGVIEADESPDVVYEADANRDGRVTADEFATIDLARLEADADLDGRISREELERFERENRRDRRAANVARGESFARQPPEVRWVRFRF